MPRLTNIQGHGLKKVRDLNVAVPPLLALKGPNGSGKTSVHQLLKIGVLGHDPVIGKRLQDTRTLAGADEIMAALTFDSGFGIRRRIGKSMQTRVAPPREGEQTEAALQGRIDEETGSFLPAFHLESFTSLSPEKRKAELLRMLPRESAGLDEDEFRRWLGYDAGDGTVRMAIENLWTKHVVTNASAVDGLAAALEAARLKKNEIEDQRQRQADIAQRADEDAARASASVEYDPSRIDQLQAELSAVEQQIGEIREQLEAAQRAESAVRERDHQRRTIEERERQAAAAARAAATSLEGLRTDPAADVSALAEATERAAVKARSQREAVAYTQGEAQRVREAHRRAGAAVTAAEQRLGELESLDVCPTCGSVASLEEARATARHEIDLLSAERDLLGRECQRADQDAAEALEAQHELDSAERTVRAEMERAQRHAETVAAVERDLARQQEAQKSAEQELLRLKALAPIATPQDVPDPRPLQERAVAIRDEIRAQQDLARHAGKAEAERERAERERTAHDRLVYASERVKAIHGGLQKLRAHVIQRMVEPIEAHANEILQAIDPRKTFRFVFEREERAVCEFGFEEDGQFRSYETASKGEEMFLAVVFIAALLEEIDPPWRVLLIDDAEGIDDERRGWLMEAIARLSDRFHNVVMSGCCEFPAVEGWDVVDVQDLVPARPALVA